MRDRVLSVGESQLTGVRGSIGRAVARPIARRTRFSEEQIAAFMGLALLGFTIWRLVRVPLAASRPERRRR